MKISAATYTSIFELMDNIATGPSISGETQADIDVVRGAITAGEDGTAELREGSGARAALGRLIDEKPRFTALTSIVNSAARFDEPAVWRTSSFMPLYSGSQILQGISDGDIATPQLAIEILHKLREAIAAEQNASREADGRIPEDYSLSTLAWALVAGGRISGNTQSYTRLAGARDLYDGSEILQDTPTDALKTPQALIEHLVKVRQEMVDEQNKTNSKKTIENYALAKLAWALVAGGRISGNTQSYTRLAGARDLYDGSEILQDTPTDALKTPQALIEHLVKVRQEMVDEQNKTSSKKTIENYALTTLVQALEAAGRISGNTQSYMRLAGARDLYDGSEILQNTPTDALKTPQALIEHLVKVRQEMVDEQNKTSSKKTIENYALATLVLALEAAGRISGNTQSYMRLAGARDLYDGSEILQNTPTDALKTPQALIEHLVKVRQEMVDEQNKTSSKKTIENYALATLAWALEAGGRISGNTQSYTRLAGARDLYDGSEILQDTPTDALKTPQALIEHLVKVRQEMVDEQNKTSSKKTIENYALTTLVQALEAGGRISGNTQSYMRLTDALDLYDTSPTLQNLPQQTIDNDELLMRTLLAKRDKIALEASDAKRSGEWQGLATLILALHAAGRINKKHAIRLDTAVGSPLSYFLKRQEAVQSEVRNLINRGITRGIFHYVDRDLFTSIVDTNHIISDQYIRRIIKWGRWLLTDPDVALRSIYGADEIAFMTLIGASAYGIDIPENAVEALEIAAELKSDDDIGARQLAVKALLEINDSLIDASDIDEKTADFLKWTNRLVEWNADALGDDAQSSADNQGDPSSDQVAFSASDLTSESFGGFLDLEATILGTQHMLELEQASIDFGITTQIHGDGYFFTPIAPRFATPAARPVR